MRLNSIRFTRRPSQPGPSLAGNPFLVLDPRARLQGRLVAYIVREHARARPLADILCDSFVAEHATAAELGLLLDDPNLIHRLGEQCLDGIPPQELPPAA
jgi:hypothetical protein